MAETNAKAPVYRYFTADLLTNEILSEIPFKGVTYERAIKGAGRFSGSIAINPQTEPLNLYESTMPGNTALFVVRDGLCVWGGIIWSREYDIVSRTLQVSGNEFTSYFYHRRIWKTWNHEYGAILEVDSSGLGTVSLDYGMTEPLKIGSSVYITFSSGADVRFDNYYTVGDDVTPTTDTFSLDSINTVTDITTISRSSGTATFVTDGYHHLAVGDLVDISVELYSEFTGRFTVGSVIDSANNVFSVQMSGSNVEEVEVTGSVSRPIPENTYYGLTVTTSTDTFDYIRKLINAVMDDFSGISFPNSVIEPGLTYSLDITKKKIADGYATITTSTEHLLAEGQNVKIFNLDSTLDGEYSVYRTPTAKSFTFAKSGSVSETSVAVLSATITSVIGFDSYQDADGNIVLGEIIMTTATAHGFRVGDSVEIATPLGYQVGTRVPNGTYKITKVTSTTFSYVSSSGSVPLTTFGDATATVGATSLDVVSAYISSNSVTVITHKPHVFSVTNTVTITGASPYHEIKSRSINYQPQTTDVAIQSIVRSGTTVTVTTKAAHSLNKYERVTIADTGNASLNITATITAISSPTVFTYSTVSSGTISAITVGKVQKHPIASLTTLDDHHLEAGDGIEVKNVGESIPIDAVQYVVNGEQTGTAVSTSSQSRYIVTLVMSANHGFEKDNYVTVSGSVNASFNGTFRVETVSHVVPYSVSYKVGTSATIASASDTGATIKTKKYAEITTSIPHKLKSGQAVTFSAINDSYVVQKVSMASGTATVNTSTDHNIITGDSVTVANLYEEIPSTNKSITEGVVTLTLASTSGLAVNDSITVSGLTETYTITHAARANNKVTIYIDGTHNIVRDDTINPQSISDKFEGAQGNRGAKKVLSVSGNAVVYAWSDNPTKLEKGVTIKKTSVNGYVIKMDSTLYNGDKTVSAVTPTSLSYEAGDPTIIKNITISPQAGQVKFLSKANGTYPVSSTPTSKKISYVVPGSSTTFAEKNALKQNDSADTSSPSISGPSPLQRVSSPIVGDILNTYTFQIDMAGYALVSRGSTQVAGGLVYTTEGVFNGTRTVFLVPTDDPKTVQFSVDRDINGASVQGEAINNYAYYKAIDLFNGASKTISAVELADNSLSYAKTHSNVPAYTISGKGIATVRPTTISSTYGGFPGNSDIDIQFSTGSYSGVNIKPTLYRGFELASVGEALDKYSDSINGFEYRIDCDFNEDTLKFTKTFVLIPIDFPDPPAPGEVSPISRYGADEYIFEYPGNIANVAINESAENSSTRFFALGTNDAGADEGANYSAASDTELLSIDSFGRKWPLLDDDEKIDNTDDKNVLYAYAKKYMTESRPPDAEITLAVNGSLEPVVGTYAPGDWCAIVIDDQFVRARLATDFEPRDNVLVRKIEAYSVSVPDGATFPEKVTLKVVPEWEVDKRG